MNYPKTGIFIKPESFDDSEIIQAALYRNGLFFSKENDGIFIGENAHDIKNQLVQINDIIFTSGIIANIHPCKPEQGTRLNVFND